MLTPGRNVPVRECEAVTEEQCETLSKTACTVSPQVNCRDIQRKVPHTLQRRKPVEVCGAGASSSEVEGESFVIDV